MNPLEQFPQVRQWAYRAFWVVGIVLGAIQAFCAATEANAPTWVGGALAVLAYVSIATNYTADRNVSPTSVTETPLQDRGFVVDAENPEELQRAVAEAQKFQSGGPVKRNESGFIDNSVVVTIMCIVVIIAGLIFIVRAL